MAAFAALALFLAADSGVEGPSAVPTLARATAASLLLFAAAGEALTHRLLPIRMAPLRALFVVPVGAIVASLALTVLGFAGLPLAASVVVVLVGGAAASVLVRRRTSPRGGESARTVKAAPSLLDRRVLAIGSVAAIVAAVALIPVFRAGFATIPGQNPDAHLVTGSAELLRTAPPTEARENLPVDRVPSVWRSKYPILYSLAAVSELSGLDPIEAFPAMAAVAVAITAVGFALLATTVLGASTGVATVVCAVTGASSNTLHVALHPYWNQLWGLAALPLAILLAWEATSARDGRAMALFALTLLFAALAYPLMIPYPLLALAAFALVLRSRPRLPRWSRRRWVALGAALAVLLAVPVVGVVEKVVTGFGAVLSADADLAAWRGDVREFFPIEAFVSLPGGPIAFVALCCLAVLGLVRGTPRAPALGLAALLALSALAALRLRLLEFGTYFDFKHLSFVGPIVLTLAAVGAGWLIQRRRVIPVALGATALLAFTVAATHEVRDELRTSPAQVTREMLELRQWGARLEANASVRLDIPPSVGGLQLWAGYMLSPHPLTAPCPVRRTTYPHAPRGVRADYVLRLTKPPRTDPDFDRCPILESRRARRILVAHSSRPLWRNKTFELRRVERLPKHLPRTASRRMVEGLKAGGL